MKELGVAHAIAQLRNDISEAMRMARDDSLQFALGPVEVELQLQLQSTATASAGLKWVVVSIGGEAKAMTTSAHRIKFVLTPSVDGGPVLVGDEQQQEPE
ncbi:MAG: hypothetical protein MNPFHGCM_00639 [Gemmatimonadaceae bacterium]|nr:hypothetical protein [Gemmatimonadaceae bacterium]